MENREKVPENRTSYAHLVLKRADQCAIAVILLVCFAIMTVSVVYQMRDRQGLVHIERGEYRKIEFRVDVNRAGWPELANLPGIGEELARRIVEYREQHGSFKTVDSLLNVKGIGEKKLEQIKYYLLQGPDGNLVSIE
ncbi:MAG TPA: helix-hairpin-helix domain-containing protein [Pirellulaceae bacterium]|nr:helix-hairpin-helix domain-containing protein [Pirellulaceae bacterium]HMO93305.1 helix-hairpin-helix domain-containing protein [Pirellulaceae bacterium]HMP69156.1 helix-hairpin-helix domain-containing protein [Pirellulaceae bacterium]